MPKQKLLLTGDVPHLGKAGDVVDVSDGLSRNFLLPRKLAVAATDQIVARRKMIEVRRAKNAQAKRADAEVLVKKLADLTVTLQAACGPDGKLYGSIGPREIVKALLAEGVSLAVDAVELPEPLKEIGTHTVPIRLHAEVSSTVRVWIVEK